jgi:hypothetical protein
MIQHITYIAEDGTEFSNEDECLDYEHDLRMKSVEEQLRMYDEKGEPTKELEKAFYVEIDTKEAGEFINEWGCQEDITHPFEDMKVQTGRFFYTDGGHWRNFDTELSYFREIEEIFNKNKIGG